MNETKIHGRVYTPIFLVNQILECVGYNTYDNIIGKHIIDNSCGDGAFLIEIVKRYCKLFNGTKAELKKDLETYIHGIEIDTGECEKCITNLNNSIYQYNLGEIKWDIINGDTLSITKYDSRMDYVVGNPPYVRVHNLNSSYDNVKSYRFANNGMTDLYLVFFEIGFNMLKSNGQLCYITPSSWLNSLAASNMRRHIMKHKNLVALIDLEHFQAFEKITTYTLISHFKNNNNNNSFNYFTYNSTNLKFIERLNLNDIYIDSYFYLGKKEQLQTLKDIKNTRCAKFVSVKNGFATLADSIFIGDSIPESSITIRVIKSSTGKWYKCIFPYNEKGKPLTEDKIFENENIKQYLFSNRENLLKGDTNNIYWYLYGRTQALADVYRPKLSINTLVRNTSDFKLVELNSGEGIYSGLYAITDFDISFDKIKSIIASDNFIEYVKMLKKYKSGGYYTFNSKDIEQYINYTLTKYKSQGYALKSTIFNKNTDLFQGVY